MTSMRRNLFLYLAFACFLGLILIFFFDGYMGVYDTTYITVGEQQQIIEPDFWFQQRGYEYPYYISAQRGSSVFFRFEIDNRQFSSYSTRIEASLWRENQKLLELYSGEKSIAPFDKVMAEWTLSSEQLEPPAAGMPSQYTIKISYGEVERRIVVDFYSPQEYIVPPEKY